MSIENPTTVLFDGNGNPIGVPGNPLSVTGSVSISEPITGSVGITGTAQVTGSVAITQPISVSNFPATQQVTGTVHVDNFPAQQTVTGSVTVAGTVNVGNLPATQQVTGTIALSEPAHVIIDSPQPLPVTGSLTVTVSKSNSAAVNAVAASTFSTQLLPANANRNGAIFFNDSPSPVYLLFGSGSTLTNWTYRAFAYGVIELNEPIFTGIISAVWSRATGSMRVTELT